MTVILITHYMDEAVLADRVLVMQKGEIVMDGTPKQVFSHTKELKGYGLDGPQGMELSHNLIEMGFDIPSDIIDIDECAEALIGFLQ